MSRQFTGFCWLLATVCLGLFSLPASAATLNVPATYATIQAAINASVNGDTVLIADGTYAGPGNVDLDFGGKNITVTSQNGPVSTIIDCGGFASSDGSGNHRGFYLHSGEASAVISGVTVKNGYETYVNGIEDSGNGGGICIDGGGVTVQNCIITGNTASGGGVTGTGVGGGVYNGNYYVIPNGPTALINCIISNNTASSYGGGVFNINDDAASTITLTNCTISGNRAVNGDGESAFGYGGGVYNENVDDNAAGTITLTSCTFTGNTATDGGGVF